MKLFRNLSQISGLRPTALTIGNFDGVHFGHLKIIEGVKKVAAQKNLASAILTFFPHPILFLNKQKPRDFLLQSLAQKLEIFREIGIDYVFILPFNKNFSEISAKNFTSKILVESLKMQHLSIGYDFTFGKNREGNFKNLEADSKIFGFDLQEVLPIKVDEQTCSSTLIRQLLRDGKSAEVQRILGRNFAVSGLVIEGKKLARQLGFPTANLKAKPQIIKPKFGVYKSEVFIPHLKQKFAAITNFGIKPTVDSQGFEPLFETHIPNFDANLYGKKISVALGDFLREEKKFASLDELKNQIISDLKK
jgi:riboflavin kinase/FMN adenylyltransferase